MSPTIQIFLDPSGRRWSHLRPAFRIALLLMMVFAALFAYRLVRVCKLPGLLLSVEQRASHAITAMTQKGQSAVSAKKTKRPMHASMLPVSPKEQRGTADANLKSPVSQAHLEDASARTGKGIRAAFYAPWDAASYESLRDALHELDLVFPEWLHVLDSDGAVHTLSAELIPEQGSIKVDDNITPLLVKGKARAKLVPEVANFDELQQRWIPAVGQFFTDVAARTRFRQQVINFVVSGRYAGLMINFQGFDASAVSGYCALIKEVAEDLHARGLMLYVAVPANEIDYPYAFVAAQSDGVILLNYGQHSPETEPGALSGQEWFQQNLRRVLGLVPRDKLICGIANYGYDWTFPEQITDAQAQPMAVSVNRISAQDAWQDAQDSGAAIEFDPLELNPHLALIDEPDERHEVWYTDAATAANQMRGAQQLGVGSFALFRLGTEDRSLWAVWEHPENVTSLDLLRSVPPGHEVNLKGTGEVLTITGSPSYGWRRLVTDESGLIRGEDFQKFPTSYEADQHGVSYDDDIAITFDDGPDPEWTPKILDVLKAEHVPATFFLIGSEASKHPALLRRIFREGHEIGNHTWSHPDISKISPERLRRELNLTEKLFEAELGVTPLLFRPPYAIDSEPDIDEQVHPIEIAQEMGYVAVGDKIDPKDWAVDKDHSADEILDDVLSQLNRGNIILLHDGGGNRSETLRALPAIIHELRDEGYNLVPVSQLLGKSRAEVMPAVPSNERLSNLFERLGFSIYSTLYAGFVLFFKAGTALIVLRLLFFSGLAIFSRFRQRRKSAAAEPSFQ